MKRSFASAICWKQAAPLWAHHVAHTDPFTNHLTSTIKEGSKTKDVVAPNGIPIGPQWFAAGGKYFLGADQNGRDVMVRLSTDFRCITVDPPGIGLSAPIPRTDATLQLSARAVAATIDALDLRHSESRG